MIVAAQEGWCQGSGHQVFFPKNLARLGLNRSNDAALRGHDDAIVIGRHDARDGATKTERPLGFVMDIERDERAVSNADEQ